MTVMSTNGKCLFIARHGETIFNKAGRIQGDHEHTPLTLKGIAQADEMGRALARQLDDEPQLEIIASDTGRTLQTLSVICEHIAVDWHQVKADPRLRKIDMGEWGGVWYKDLAGKLEIDRENMLFANVAPGGESYPDIAVRLRSWLADQKFDRDAVVISHGMTSRVLRGLLTGMDDHDQYAAPIADGLPQGSLVKISDGREEIVHLGVGESDKA